MTNAPTWPYLAGSPASQARAILTGWADDGGRYSDAYRRLADEPTMRYVWREFEKRPAIDYGWKFADAVRLALSRAHQEPESNAGARKRLAKVEALARKLATAVLECEADALYCEALKPGQILLTGKRQDAPAFEIAETSRGQLFGRVDDRRNSPIISNIVLRYADAIAAAAEQPLADARPRARNRQPSEFARTLYATFIKREFASPLYGTVARITTIALALPPGSFKAEHAENCLRPLVKVP